MSESKKNPSPDRSFIINTVVLLGVVALLAFISIPNFVRSPHTGPKNACINNLRQIDSAKYSWSLENRKQSNDIPSQADIARYLKNNEFPACPNKGTYTIGRVADDPTCTISGHLLPAP